MNKSISADQAARELVNHIKHVNKKFEGLTDDLKEHFIPDYNKLHSELVSAFLNII